MPIQDKETLKAAYREALSSDFKLRDYYARQWRETRVREEAAKLSKHWREMVRDGRAKIEIADDPPTLTPERIATLREFFTKRLHELEQ